MGIVVHFDKGARHGTVSRDGGVDYVRLDREWDRVRAHVRPSRQPHDALGVGPRLVLWYAGSLLALVVLMGLAAWLEGLR